MSTLVLGADAGEWAQGRVVLMLIRCEVWVAVWFELMLG